MLNDTVHRRWTRVSSTLSRPPHTCRQASRQVGNPRTVGALPWATPVYFISIEARDYFFNGYNGGIPRNDRGVAIPYGDRAVLYGYGRRCLDWEFIG